MAGSNEEAEHADGDNILAMPITVQTPKAQQLEAARLRLAPKQARLNKRQAALDLHHEQQLQHTEALRGRGRDVHNTLQMCEKEGVKISHHSRSGGAKQQTPWWDSRSRRTSSGSGPDGIGSGPTDRAICMGHAASSIASSQSRRPSSPKSQHTGGS